MDGFHQDESEDKGDEGAEVASRFLASESDAFEALELADELLDAGAGPIEDLRQRTRGGFFSLALCGITGVDAAARGPPRGWLAIRVALVADGGARLDVGTEVEEDLEQRAVAGLAAGQVEGERQAVEDRS